MNWEDSLALGEKVEKDIIRLLRKKHPCTMKIEGKFKPFDIYIPETDTKIEVKRDIKSLDTGNFVVEVEMFGKPSGLCATKADWLVFTDMKQLIWVRPNKLKDAILMGGFTLRRFTGNGDTEPKKAFLLKVDMLVDCADKITDYPNE